jgi:hypothetical protein
MTIPQLAHQDSTERATSLFGFNAWLDAQKPSHEEQEKILNAMHEEDLARQADENGNRFRSIGDQLAH